jgi:hypothetical protein
MRRPQVQLSDRDLLVIIITGLVSLVAGIRVNFTEGAATFAMLWAAYMLGKSHPPA